MSIKKQYIPAPLASAVKNGYVTDTSEILDKNKGKRQDVINQETDGKIDNIKGGSSKSIAELDTEIQALEKQDVVPVDALPAVSTADPKKIYRVVGETSYIDYMVNAAGDGWKELAEFSFPGIDDVPDKESLNLISSKGIAENIAEFVNSDEFKKIEVDDENKIIEAIDPDDIHNHYLKQRFHNDVRFEGKIDGTIVNDKTRYIENNDEYLELTLDEEDKILESTERESGKKTFNTPVDFLGDVYFGGNVDIPSYNNISNKYASPRKPLRNIFGTVHQGDRDYTKIYSDAFYNVATKCGITIIRDETGVLVDGHVHPSTPLNIATIKGITTIGMVATISPILELNTILTRVIETIMLYDGNEHIVGDDVIKCNINSWMVFNEPDMYYDRGQISAQGFFELQKATYNTIKQYRPECAVICGGFADITGTMFRQLAEIRDTEGKAFWDYTDIIAFHHYGDNVYGLESALSAFRDLCNSVYSNNDFTHLKDKPIWITEFDVKPFTDSYADATRCKILPKQALVYLSYGIEKLLVYKLWSYNYFIVTPKDNYYGLVTPHFNCAYAGFTYNDIAKSSLTADNLLNKTYIWPSKNFFYTALDLLDKSEIQSKGIAINGNGFTITRVYIAERNTSTSEFYEIHDFNVSSTVMDGTNVLPIAGNLFLDGYFAPNYCLVVEISDITMTDTSLSNIVYSDAFYAIKFINSLLTDIEDVPNIVTNNDYTIVSWRKTNGLYNYALWGNKNNAEITASVDAEFYDVLGNKLNTIPTSITDSPIYIVNSNNLKIK